MAVVGLAVALLVVAGPASAQFTNYRAPGSLAEPQVPTKERLEAAMEDARFRFGPVRLAPWFGLRSLTYYDDVYPELEGKQSDFTARLGVGLNAYMPVSPRFILTARALPEYEWWQDLSHRSRWNGSYGAGVFGYFNRLTLESSLGTQRRADFISSELELPIYLRQDHANALVELALVRRLSLYTTGSLTRWRYDDRDAELRLGRQLDYLDRDETSVGAGLRYQFRRWLAVAVGVERFEADFVTPEVDRSNSGTAPTLEAELTLPRLRARARVSSFDLQPEPGSQFVAYEGETGQARLSYEVRPNLVISVYGARDLAFTIGTFSSHYINRRTGVSLQLPTGHRIRTTVFGETGSNDYVLAPPNAGTFREDLKAYGASLNIQLGRSIGLAVIGSQTDYDQQDGTGRSYTRIQTGLSFGTGSPFVW